MQVVTADSHYQRAVALTEQRFNLLQQTFIHADQLALYEYQLQIHLAILAQDLSLLKVCAVQTAAQAFVFLCAHFNAAKPDATEKALKQIQQWLPNPDFRTAITQALILYPPSDGGEFLLNQYYVEPTLRPYLLGLWWQICASVPASILQKALKSDVQEVLIGALKVVAWVDTIDTSVIQQYYQSNNIDVALTALLGGVMRNDNNALNYIQKLSVNTFSVTQRQQYLRLLALCRQSELLLFQQLTCDEFLYLAILGDKKGLPLLLEALRDVRYCESAAIVWYLLTGNEVLRKSRLSVHVEEGISSQSKQTIPDADAALNWFEEHAQDWTDEFYLLGKVQSQEMLTSIFKSYTGTWCTELGMLQQVLYQTGKMPEWQKWRQDL